MSATAVCPEVVINLFDFVYGFIRSLVRPINRFGEYGDGGRNRIVGPRHLRACPDVFPLRPLRLICAPRSATLCSATGGQIILFYDSLNADSRITFCTIDSILTISTLDQAPSVV